MSWQGAPCAPNCQQVGIYYLIRLADKLDINLITAAQRKIEVNERKYPVGKVKGSAKKYTEYE